ncbi:hypothetical protein [Psychrobacillus sp. OK028]|uniref:hypothetical protein n=1 Tax=Psychrobacillus sp. OK028 TaxID=1884359 RepID=UPI0011142038|nr:hypothetical protein [Psychrobacillus sp. OK028]
MLLSNVWVQKNFQEVTDEKILKKIVKEINNSRREGTEEMEFPEGHDVALETVSGATYGMVLFDGGKSLIEGFYIHSDIPKFCSEKRWREDDSN